MNSETRQLIMDVMDGNPGALTIIRRLMYFAPWPQLLQYLKDQGLVGSELWRVVKDEYEQDWTQFVHDKLEQMGHELAPTYKALGRYGSSHHN